MHVTLGGGGHINDIVNQLLGGKVIFVQPLHAGRRNSISQCFAYHSYYWICTMRFEQSEVLHEIEVKSCVVGLT